MGQMAQIIRYSILIEDSRFKKQMFDEESFIDFFQFNTKIGSDNPTIMAPIWQGIVPSYGSGCRFNMEYPYIFMFI